MVGPEGKLKKYDRKRPETDEKTPKIILTYMDGTNVSVICFDAAAGIKSMLKTKIIPTVWREGRIATDKIMRNK